MKNKIAVKLAFYCIAIFLVFAVVVGGVFMQRYTQNVRQLHKTDMENRAAKIADTLAGYLQEEENLATGHGHQARYGAYLGFLEDIAMTNVWVVDENCTTITRGTGQTSLAYKDLPKDAEVVVREVFAGATSYSESFSDLLNVQSITVGTPIFNHHNQVVGAVLLHAPLEDVAAAIDDGARAIKASVVIAFFVAILLAAILSLHFTNPLQKMKKTALLLKEGDYTAKTHVQQRDEIGELAGILDQLADRLLVSSKESEHLEHMRQEFVANVSHELRTPVTVMRASLEALCDGVIIDPIQMQHYHKQMLAESIHLQRLVTDLLDLTKLQSVDFSIDMQTMYLNDVIEDVIRSLRTVAKRKDIAIVWEKGEIASNIVGDYARMRQLLLILLDNAIKFSLQGGEITIDLQREERLILSVQDQGEGIAAEDMPYIYDRFFKVNSKENQHGTGLGLSIAKQIADRHAIDLVIESELGVGTKVSLVFPV